MFRLCGSQVRGLENSGVHTATRRRCLPVYITDDLMLDLFDKLTIEQQRAVLLCT